MPILACVARAVLARRDLLLYPPIYIASGALAASGAECCEGAQATAISDSGMATAARHTTRTRMATSKSGN